MAFLYYEVISYQFSRRALQPVTFLVYFNLLKLLENLNLGRCFSICSYWNWYHKLQINIIIDNLTRHWHVCKCTTVVLRPSFWKPWTLERIWSWLYSNGVSEKLRAWSFIHTSLTLQYMSEGILFSRLLKDLICDPSIWKL